MECWNCGTELHLSGKVSFRATCDKCHFYLHCCKNCRNYRPGLSNDCAVPGTDPISDRTANNYCEEFEILGKATGKKDDSNAAEKRLFGDSILKKPEPPENRFNSLFKDQ